MGAVCSTPSSRVMPASDNVSHGNSLTRSLVPGSTAAAHSQAVAAQRTPCIKEFRMIDPSHKLREIFSQQRASEPNPIRGLAIEVCGSIAVCALTMLQSGSNRPRARQAEPAQPTHESDPSPADAN